MRTFRSLVGWLGGGVFVSAWLIAWTHFERESSARGLTVFTPARGCAIIVARDAAPEDTRAAELIRATLAKAAGLAPSAFPLEREGAFGTRDGIYVGSTRRGATFLARPEKPPFDTAVGCWVANGAVFIRSERPQAAEIAASWFLRSYLDAQWFMPGPLGEVIPRRTELTLTAQQEIVRPWFISRDLGVGGGADARAWYTRNGFEARFHHSHNLDSIFKPEDLRANPELAPMRLGRRHFPPPGSYNWQPDLTSPAAVEHAATVAARAFTSDPRRVSFSLSANDSARFDASARTLEMISPVRYFRTRPDYSDLVFAFSNRVAERLAPTHPDRFLPTYAYYWAENTPRFPVAKNVIPYLTADRGQWFDPEFAAEDQALIRRWTKSGAEIVGVYDYLYGICYLIPRPLLTTVSESIPFHHQSGVRAFYAESTPNWSVDGPKGWLIGQLLWDPTARPEALLAKYYREFWQEAAEPMRAFDEVAERAWLEQPRPGYWIKYFQDEQQALLFSPMVRAQLNAALARARSLAQTAEIKARIDFVAAGWGVSESFAAYCEARDQLSRLTLEPGNSTKWSAAWLAFVQARGRFLARNSRVRAEHPLALAEQKIDVFTRNDPSARAARSFVVSELGRQFLQAHPELRPTAITTHQLVRLFAEGRQVLVDREWKNVRPKSIATPVDFEFLEPGGEWQASGEPSEHRSITWSNRRGNSAATSDESRVLRFAGCRQEFIVQWRPTKPGALYVAEVDVRAKVSPGNQTFLIVNFLDEGFQRVGVGHLDRLPAGDEIQAGRLCVIARAPANARYVGVGARVLNQVNDDFAEFSDVSLKELE